jgi:hypothetical protein
VVGGYEGGRGDGGVLVDDARLDETLNGLDGRGVDDTAQGTDGVCAVDDVAADGRVLHDGRGDHDDIVGRAGELLDDQVDHLAERGIFVLEELGDAEEERGGFLAAPALAGEEQQGELGEDDSAFARRDGALVEDSGVLEDGRLVNLGDAADVFVLLVHGARNAALAAGAPLGDGVYGMGMGGPGGGAQTWPLPMASQGDGRRRAKGGRGGVGEKGRDGGSGARASRLGGGAGWRIR